MTEEKEIIYRPRYKLVSCSVDEKNNGPSAFHTTRLYIDDKPIRVKSCKVEVTPMNFVRITLDIYPRDVEIMLEDPEIIIDRDGRKYKLMKSELNGQ